MPAFAHRWGRERPRLNTVEVREVLIAIGRDEWARHKLGEIHRKLFEGEGIRQGASPDHFLYVTPGKARTEIGELSSWISERFGDPGSTVPATTPFGYLSGKYDGWITLFAALAYGGPGELRVDFGERVARMPWGVPAGPVRPRTVGATAGEGAAEPSAEPTSGSTLSTRLLTPFSVSHRREPPPPPPVAPRPPSPPPPPPAAPPAPKTPFMERFLGVKPTQAHASELDLGGPRRRPLPSLPPDEPPWTEEELAMTEEELRAEEEALAARALADAAATRQRNIRFRSEVEAALRAPASAPASATEPAPTVKKGRKKKAADVASLIEETAKASAEKATVEQEGASTVEKLRRSPGSTPTFG